MTVLNNLRLILAWLFISISSSSLLLLLPYRVFNLYFACSSSLHPCLLQFYAIYFSSISFPSISTILPFPAPPTFAQL